MKRIVLFAAGLLVFISCQKKESEKTSKEATRENIPAFDENVKNLSVKDLALKSKDDTISYALGVAWGSQLAGKAGLQKVSYTFYEGAHDFLVQNKTFVTLQRAMERLDKEIDVVKKDSTHSFDASQKIGDITLKSSFDTVSYLLGFCWMRGAKEIGISKLTPTLMLGLTKAMKGDSALFTFATADRYLRGYIEDEREKKFLAIKTRNQEWLEQNKTHKDVVTLPSGLQYKIIREGTGKSPAYDDIIVCHYTGKLIDNTKFESSYDEGKPLKAYPSGVIPAWREALPKMKVGSVWELYVPYNLGYGSGGIKNKVPPFSTLIYEIELLGVEHDAR